MKHLFSIFFYMCIVSGLGVANRIADYGSGASSLSMPSDTLAQEFSFSSCGNQGRYGPNSSECSSSYAGTTLDGLVTVSGSYQLWTVPETGTYEIDVAGASGGKATSYSGYDYNGKGARIKASVELNQGDVLKIMVGQMGQDANYFGGGGGGTFVALSDDTPIIVAGGGAGQDMYYDFLVYANASLTTSGNSSSPDYYNGAINYYGGSNGLGGETYLNSGPGAGAGFYSNGQSGVYSSSGGEAFIYGGTGGYENSSGAGEGGFGGGGGAHNGSNFVDGSGGGGGYSGGAGGGSYSYSGGGGGSYYSDGAALIASETGLHDGHGFVKIRTTEIIEAPFFYAFNSCNTEGREGPSQSDCNSSYSGTRNFVEVDTLLSGIQLWTVPSSGTYLINAAGASGGKATDYLYAYGGYMGMEEIEIDYNGKGARIKSSVELNQGDVLKIMVGQKGQDARYFGGGGGGTFIALNDNTPLVVAGGGAGQYKDTNYLENANASLSTSGNNSSIYSSWNSYYTGGSNGTGGYTYSGSGSGAGGGFWSDGQDGPYNDMGGQAFVNGGQGGNNDNDDDYSGKGGFGGGGGANNGSNSYDASGGGGGYSGGAGGGNYSYSGGGGGSYYSDGAALMASEAGLHDGHGEVAIYPYDVSLLVDSDSDINFGKVFIGSTVDTTINLYNSSGSTNFYVFVSSFSDSSMFSHSQQDSDYYNILSQDSLSINISFVPTEKGVYSDTLLIVNSQNSDTFSIILSGSSDTAPEMDIIEPAEQWPESLYYGDDVLRQIVVKNTGGDTLSWSLDDLQGVAASFSFSSCGNQGRDGPSSSDCSSSYAGTTLDGSVDVSGSYQLWTVPETGAYEIEAVGASGGKATSYSSFDYNGKGARIKASVELNQGDVLKIMVGQMGQDANNFGGGGGGTFVALNDNTPLLVAGGGAGQYYNSNYLENANASLSTSGNNSSIYYGSAYSGGSNGSGGSTYSSGSGAGGGFWSDGQDGDYYDMGGQAFVSGGQGGNNDNDDANSGKGGFGGGGGANNGNTSQDASGGGGGYSGGAGGGNYSYSGGGGGSYYSDGAALIASATGLHVGHGEVNIKKRALVNIDSFGGVLPSDSSSTVNVHFLGYEASNIIDRAYNLVFNSNAGTETVSFTVSYFNEQNILVQPLSLDFGMLLLDTLNSSYESKIENVKVKNIGSSNLIISAVNLLGSNNFSIAEQQLPLTVIAGDSLALPISFSATDKGEFSATFSIESNDTDEPTKSIVLQGGAGYPQRINVSVSSLTGTLYTNGSDSTSFTIENSGDFPLSWSTDVKLNEVATTYSFSSCGNQGRDGPSSSDCSSSYAGTSLDGSVDVSGSYQLWTVPETGAYEIEAVGASGGKATSYSSFDYNGKGARIKASVELNQGDVLKIMVGQRGQDADDFGGGGGGTFVALNDNTPIVVAGGGAGQYMDTNYLENVNASLSTSGNNSSIYSGYSGDTYYSGGSNGSGGSTYQYSGSGAGGGFNSDGQDGFYNDMGGQAFVSGGQGGDNDNDIDSGDGGFGGGGGANDGSTAQDASGGGGGYSGGAGGGYYSYSGGGGGSYYSDDAALIASETGLHDGHGEVKVTFFSSVWYASPREGTVLGKSSQQISIHFSDDTLDAGSYTADIDLTSNDLTQDSLITIPLSVDLVDASDIFLYGPIQMDTIYFGQTASSSFSILNKGKLPLVIGDITSSLSIFSLDTSSASIDVDDSLIVNISFNPTASGDFVSNLQIESNDPDEAQYSFIIEGFAKDRPALVVQDSININFIPGRDYIGKVKLKNKGGIEDTVIVSKNLSEYISFSSCGNQGRYAPSSYQCSSTYLDTIGLPDITVSGSYQLWTVPETGTYEIEAVGASGGKATSYSGDDYNGKGARIKASVELNQGDVLKIMVGQMGQDASYFGGGGGGTFVALNDNTPLVVAGGGAGQYMDDNYLENANASLFTSGNNSSIYSGYSGDTYYSGGSNGSGGYTYLGFGSGAGGGFNSDGQDGRYSDMGGQAFVNGGYGGDNGSDFAGEGGFGGGGGANNWYNSADASGGGGGYSGGAGGGYYSYSGGGGGSYYSDDAALISSETGLHDGHGEVRIGRANLVDFGIVSSQMENDSLISSLVSSDTLYIAEFDSVFVHYQIQSKEAGSHMYSLDLLTKDPLQPSRTIPISYTVLDSDSSAPTIELSSVVDSTFTGDTLSISWSQYDNLWIDSVRISFNNLEEDSTHISTILNQESSYSWIVPDSISNNIVLNLEAFDWAQNTGSFKSDSIFVRDVLPPSSSFLFDEELGLIDNLDSAFTFESIISDNIGVDTALVDVFLEFSNDSERHKVENIFFRNDTIQWSSNLIDSIGKSTISVIESPADSSTIVVSDTIRYAWERVDSLHTEWKKKGSSWENLKNIRIEESDTSFALVVPDLNDVEASVKDTMKNFLQELDLRLFYQSKNSDSIRFHIVTADVSYFTNKDTLITDWQRFEYFLDKDTTNFLYFLQPNYPKPVAIERIGTAWLCKEAKISFNNQIADFSVDPLFQYVSSGESLIPLTSPSELFNYLNSDSYITLNFDSYFTTTDTVSVTLEAGSIKNINGYRNRYDTTLVFSTPMIADYNLDNVIDMDDVADFIVAQTGDNRLLDLNSVGQAPHLTPVPDDKYSVEDILTLIKMWDWYGESNNIVANLSVEELDNNLVDIRFDYQDGILRLIASSFESDIGFAHVMVNNLNETFDLEKPGGSSSNTLLSREYQEGKTFEVNSIGFSSRDTLDFNIASYNPKHIDPIQSEIIYKVYKLDGSLIESGSNIVNILPLPTEYKLSNAFPNPFNPVTAFKYQVPKLSKVDISIFDIRGRKVDHLVSSFHEPGYYEQKWDAEKYSSGIYFINMKSSNFNKVIKCILVK